MKNDTVSCYWIFNLKQRILCGQQALVALASVSLLRLFMFSHVHTFMP